MQAIVMFSAAVLSAQPAAARRGEGGAEMSGLGREPGTGPQ
jgi:hypothetical protein